MPSYVEVVSGTAGVQGLTPKAGLRLVGFCALEDAGTPAAAKFALRHGTLATDPPIVFVNLLAEESTRDFFPSCGADIGVPCPGGVYVDRTEGSCVLVLYYVTMPNGSGAWG